MIGAKDLMSSNTSIQSNSANSAQMLAEMAAKFDGKGQNKNWMTRRNWKKFEASFVINGAPTLIGETESNN